MTEIALRKHSGNSNVNGVMANRRRPSVFPTDVLQTFECCLVCTQEYDEGRILDCGHIFCDRCLQHHYKTYRVQVEAQKDANEFLQTGKTNLFCPTCRKVTTLPPQGLSARSLDHSRNKNRVRKISRPAMSPTQTVEQNCEPCFYMGQTRVEAEFYCNRCTMNFCSKCKAVHEQNDIFKGHNTIHINNKDNLNISCDRHGKLPSVYYCNTCKLIGCTICMINDHKLPAHQTARLPDTVQTMKDTIKINLNDLGKKLEQSKSKISKLPVKQSTPRTVDGEAETSLTILPGPTRKDSNDNMDYEVQAINREIDSIQRLCDMSAKFVETPQTHKLLAIYDELKSRLESVLSVEMEKIQEDITNKQMEYHREMDNADGLSVANTENNRSGNTSRTSSMTSVLAEDTTNGFLLFKLKEQWKYEKQRSDPGELFYPSGLDFMDRSLIVADYENNQLRLYNMAGAQTNILSLPNIQPLAVKSLPDGNIAVTDNKGKKIKIINMMGQVVTDIGKDFGWPYGIAYNSKGQYIVTDNFHDTIYIYSKDGKKIEQIGNDGENSLRNPMHVTVNSRDDIIVADTGNNCIKVFDCNFRFRLRNCERIRGTSSSTNQMKMKKRKLHGPRGVCVDKKDNILVTDDHGRVCLYSSQGDFTRNLLTEEDSIKFPEALATNEMGLLALTEHNPNNMCAIRVFSMYE